MNEEFQSASFCSIQPSPADGPASKCLAGRVDGVGGLVLIWHLRYCTQCNIFGCFFIAGDASLQRPVHFASDLINDINANWG